MIFVFAPNTVLAKRKLINIRSKVRQRLHLFIRLWQECWDSVGVCDQAAHGESRRQEARENLKARGIFIACIRLVFTHLTVLHCQKIG